MAIDKAKLAKKVIESAGRKYKLIKMSKHPYTPPEMIPSEITSDTVKALAIALVDEFVDILESLGLGKE